jgi:predicted XRE-type DNA-binding protein
MKRISAERSKCSIIPGSGNVFSDLQLPDAEEKLTKVRLAVTINHIIESGKLKQAMALEVLKINQPKISALANYRLDEFSVERLMNFLNALRREKSTYRLL